MRPYKNFNTIFVICAFILSGCASLNKEPDLVIVWAETNTEQKRKIDKIDKCISNRCSEIEHNGLSISSGKTDGTKKEYEVCKDVNVFAQDCDVYSCIEDNVGMQSICNYKFTYRRSCWSDGCPTPP